MLKDLSIHEFFVKTAQKETPGGGSNAALMGLSGVSLIQMAAEVSLGAQQWNDVKKELQRLHETLEAFIDADAEVLEQALPALAAVGPDGNGEEWNEILLKAVEVPFQVIQSCIEGLEAFRRIKDHLYPNVACDAKFGAMSLHTALQGAVLLAQLNVSLLRDDKELSSELQDRCEAAALRGETLIDALL